MPHQRSNTKVCTETIDSSRVPLKSDTTRFVQKLRFDCYGQPILKNQKSHKIMFSDQPHTTILVENWKRYNHPDPSPEEPEDFCCPCSPF